MGIDQHSTQPTAMNREDKHMLFSKEDHPHHAPETWVVVKAAPGVWRLVVNPDGAAVLDTYTTKKAAEAAKSSGWLVSLYNDEGRWYAGGQVRNWKPSPHAQVTA